MKKLYLGTCTADCRASFAEEPNQIDLMKSDGKYFNFSSFMVRQSSYHGYYINPPPE